MIERKPATIRILGAGLSALMAATTLARAGRDVVICEQAGDIAPRRDGDLEAVENWISGTDFRAELAHRGINLNFLCTPFHRLTFFGPGFREKAVFEHTQPLFYTVLRGPHEPSLDRALLLQARSAGVRVVFNRRAQPDEVNIVAGGCRRPRSFGVGYNFRTTAQNGSYVLFDDQFAPRSYAYLILCEGYGTVVAGAHTPQRGMRERLPRVLDAFRCELGFDVHHLRYFAAGLSYWLPESAQQGGRLYTGEAAGFQDAISGFGVRMSLTSGHLAACCLLDGSDYDEKWRAKLLPTIEACAVNRFLRKYVGNRGYSVFVRLLNRVGSGYDFLHRRYNPAWYTPLILPLARRWLNGAYHPTSRAKRG